MFISIAILRDDELKSNQQFYNTLKNTFTVFKVLLAYSSWKKNEGLENLPNFFQHTR